MKRLFISCPMKGKSEKEILEERNRIFDEVKSIMGPVKVLDSYFPEAKLSSRPLYWLGKAIELISEADVVYFGRGWENARGCRIEHECAVSYGKETIEE